MLRKELPLVERIQPRFIEPMYAEAARELPDSDDWSYEPKLDGYRCLAAKSTGRVVLWSRRGNLFTGRFPEIARACDNLPLNTVIDGEVVAIDQDGKPTPGALKLELELDQKDAGLKELPKPEQIYDFSLLEEIAKSNR
jgi:ATP-dependent DNA ligase